MTNRPDGKMSRDEVVAMFARKRARLEQAVHKVDDQCGRDAATAVRDEILFEFDRQVELALEELFGKEKADG